MADRSVSVNLKADVSNYVAGVGRSAAATADLGKTATKAAKDFEKAAAQQVTASEKAAKAAEAAATKHHEAQSKIGKGMLITGGVIALGVGMAVKAFAAFDKEMSGVAAVSGANAKEMDALGKAAIKAGADTVFSASEAAKAEGELAKAGVSTADILGGALTGSLNLASAGGLELANAAEISAQAMNIFKLEGKDVSHIADVLAAGANKSAADVQGLGDSLRQGGLVAAQYGLSLETTVGTLSAFADNALIGSDAGTALKTMLQRLTPTSDEAQGAMDAIGFSAYDAAGQFVGMESVAQQLKTGLTGLSDKQRDATMATMFGSDAVRGANVLYEQGAAGIKDYTAAVNDNGAAGRMASIMLNNLSGDFEALKGSIDTALIQSGSGGNDMLRTLVQTATGAVNTFGELPAPLQQGALGFAAVSAAALITGGAVLTVIPKVAATKLAMVDLGIASKLTRASMMSMATGPIGIALVGITAAVGLFAKSQMDAKARADDLRASLDQQTGAITAATRALVAKQLQEDGAFKAAKMFGVTTAEITSAAMGEAGALDILRAKQSAHNDVVTTTIAKTGDLNAKMGLTLGTQNAFAGASEKTVAGARSQSAGFDALLTSVLPINEVLSGQTVAQKELADAVGDTTTATGGAVEPTKALAQSEKDLAAAADESKKAHDALTASITGYGSAMMAARGDARSYEAAIDAATASLKENGKTLDIGTEKGRANAAALDGIATAALKVAESNLTAAETNGTLARTSKTVTTEVGKAREAFIKQAVAMGMPKEAAARLATQAGLTAGRVKEITDKLQALGQQAPKPKITVLGVADGLSAVNNLAARLKSLKDRNITVSVNQRGRIADIGNNADGTDSWRGGLTWVGERGPEILNLPKGSQVIPNHKIGNLASGTAGAKPGWMAGGKEYGSAMAARNATTSATERAAKAAVREAEKITKAAAAAAKAKATTQRDYTFTYLPSFAKALTGTSSALMTAGTSLIAHVAKTAAAHQMSSKMIVSLSKENASLGKLATSRDTLATQLKSANENLTEAQKTFTDQQSSITSSLGAVDLSKASSPAELIAQLTGQITSAKDFGAQIKTLGSQGLNASMLKQLADAGPAGEGSPLAQMMGATPSQIEQINALMAELQTTAASTGTGIATSLYGSGVQAAQGLVAGLESQQKAIEAQMLKIATGMQAAIKQALGLTVMAPAAKSRPMQYVSAPARSQSASGGSAGGDSTPQINLTTSLVLDGHVVGTTVARWSQKMVKDTGSSGLKV